MPSNLYFVTDENDPAVYYGVQWRRRLSSTRSNSSMSLARTWLSECLGGKSCHEHDGSNKDALLEKHLNFPVERPSRLIDLMLDSGNAELARLVECHDGCTEYATLSYVWGPDPHPWRTTRDNVKQRMISFERCDLPATLADAICIAGRLGLRYIWIDALCIVQDDLAEWTKEGSKMAGIYHGSYITIAATSSHSSRDGIFNHRSWSHVNPCNSVQIDNMLVNRDQSQLYFVAPDHRSAFAGDGDLMGPLGTRAWALQERYLSPRILHFTSSQLIWECDHIMQSEDNLRDVWLTKPLAYKMTRKHLMAFWYKDLVEEYCRRQLSDVSDKLVAISALAKAVCSLCDVPLCDVDYLAGMWRGSLIEGLLWYRHGHGKKTRRPSWSWSSQDSGIRYYYIGYPDHLDRQVQDVKVIKDPLNKMGSVSHGSLCLSCRIFDCQLLPCSSDHLYPSQATDKRTRFHEVLVWNGFKPMGARATMDDENHPISNGFLLYLGYNLSFLILAAVDLRSSTYERIGFVLLDPYGPLERYEDLEKFMSERPVQTITII